ncbi:MAG: peptide chain release factor N(5)-glutamine methyltransferase [Xanthobacteraceae bacterium]|nr:peptide chain release factor N(5)-glutamine methyltransferase [Xanthobacteraceae bacterium]
MQTLVLETATSVAGVRRALAAAFRGAGLESPELDARILVGFALGLDHAGLTVAAERSITSGEAQVIAALGRRRLARESVAVIVGHKEFWGLRFQVGPATLVPRPDSETLVEAALQALDAQKQRRSPIHIADLGTGSGCLLLALLSELPNARGIGIDISNSALEIARQNARALRLAYRALFVRGNFTDALDGDFDLVVANPPYVATAALADLAPEVGHEPRAALDGGPDGLSAYRAIAADSARVLRPDGVLVLELGIGQAGPVAALLSAAGLVPEEPQTDLAGMPRAIVAFRQPMR